MSALIISSSGFVQNKLNETVQACHQIRAVKQVDTVANGWLQIVELKPDILILDETSLDVTVWTLLCWLKRSWHPAYCCMLVDSAAAMKRAYALGADAVYMGELSIVTFSQEFPKRIYTISDAHTPSEAAVLV